MANKLKIGIVVVVFEENERKALAEGEAEIPAPAFPFVEDKTFRDACLLAFRNAGGDRTHQAGEWNPL